MLSSLYNDHHENLPDVTAAEMFPDQVTGLQTAVRGDTETLVRGRGESNNLESGMTGGRPMCEKGHKIRNEFE